MWRDSVAEKLCIPLVNADRMMLSILPEAGADGHLAPWAAVLRDQDRGWMGVDQQGVEAFVGHAMRAKVPFAMETVFSYWEPRPDGTVASKIDRIHDLHRAGYFVLLLFVGLASAELSILRVTTRVFRGGHGVDEPTLRKRFPKTQRAISEALKVADASILIDNSRSPAEAFTVCQLRLGMRPIYDIRDHAAAPAAAETWLRVIDPRQLPAGRSTAPGFVVMAPAMKIVHVIAGAEVGGAETFAQDAILALHGRGVEQMVFARPWPLVMARYAEAGVAARGARFSRGNLLLGRRIRVAARAMGADLVHAWMQRAGSLVPASMPCPVLGWFGDYYDLKYFRSADCFVGVTPDITRHIEAAGAPAERCFTVNTFGTMPDAAPVSRASLDTPDDAPLLLVLSRMHRVKGIDTMLHALAETPGAYLWLAGDGPERVAYERLARRLGLADRVRFLGWRNDRKALLEACDICVLPSRYEPFGTVIAEAWAMRRPLVASLADGARQYVRDGVNGLLCPIDDSPALAACLRRAIDDAGLRVGLVAGGTAAYEADFTREVVTSRLLACYQRVIELGRRR